MPQDVNLEISMLESLPKMTESQKEKYRKLLRKQATIERQQNIASNPKPRKKVFKKSHKQPKMPLPGQPTHDIMISTADIKDLLVPPPDGHGGVWLTKTLRNIEPLHRLRFYEANSPEETVALVTVTFIEGPGKSIRPDLILNSKTESCYKIHWTR